MKKILSLLLVLGMVFCLSACGGTSTTSDATEDSSGVEGLWVYEGPTGQDPSYVVNFTTEEDGSYELQIDKNITQAEQPTTNTSVISGTYTAEDGDLTLDAETVENADNTLVDVEKGSKLELTYELSADNDVITINGLSTYVTDLPDSIELEKGNQ